MENQYVVALFVGVITLLLSIVGGGVRALLARQGVEIQRSTTADQEQSKQLTAIKEEVAKHNQWAFGIDGQNGANAKIAALSAASHDHANKIQALDFAMDATVDKLREIYAERRSGSERRRKPRTTPDRRNPRK